MEKSHLSPVQKRQEINSLYSPHSSAVSLERENPSSNSSVVAIRAPAIEPCCSVDHWKRLLLPNLHCRHDFAKTHCHGRSISALPDLGIVFSSPDLKAGVSDDLRDQIEVSKSVEQGEEGKTIKTTVQNKLPVKKRVHFHSKATVREYPLIVGDVVTPNYDGCANIGIPLSLGWEFEEKIISIYSDSNQWLCRGSKTVDDMMLTAKERVEKLKKFGGYSDRELWKIQRELTLRDRKIFFSGENL